MPKENKHARGRRGEKDGKRKRTEEDDEHHTKRQKSAEADEIQFVGTDNVITEEAEIQNSTERPFYGLLDDEEQEYFRRADELLELNDFPSQEERSLFLANVYKEAEGKELKIANSQSCSRLMERLILLSTPEQKKKLFETFSGNFLHLVQHRFASHCCEALFIHSAPIVTEEITGDIPTEEAQDGKEDGIYVSMENLFLYTLNELEGQMAFLLTDRFASHALRVLLIVLSGQSLATSSTRSLLQSKRKEKIGITGLEPELSLEKRPVPSSFQFAIQKIIADTVIGLDSTFVHVLATHPTGNPTLQLLLELELTQPGGKGKNKNTTPTTPETKTILQTLLPDDPTTEDSVSASFINGLIYDPLGSRLLETIIRFAPGKLFKSIYRSTFRDRIGALSRNDMASFTVSRVLERLSKEDLEEAVNGILPQIPSLIKHSVDKQPRTSVIKTLFERCQARHATASIKELTKAVEEAYGSEPSKLLLEMTGTTAEALSAAIMDPSIRPDPTANTITTHGSLLAQSLLSVPGPPAQLVQSALLAIPSSTLLSLALTTSTSHIIQAALVPTESNVLFRRKFVNLIITPSDLYADPVLSLALSKPGSHVLDSLFTTTNHSSLMMLKERICAILVGQETTLRDDYVGRVVWRNWMCELFRRRKGDWVTKVRSGEGGSTTKPVGQAFTNNQNGSGGTEGQEKDVVPISGKLNGKQNGRVPGKGRGGKDTNGKSAIELAREKFAAAKTKKDNQKAGRLTGANAI